MSSINRDPTIEKTIALQNIAEHCKMKKYLIYIWIKLSEKNYWHCSTCSQLSKIYLNTARNTNKAYW